MHYPTPTLTARKLPYVHPHRPYITPHPPAPPVHYPTLTRTARTLPHTHPHRPYITPHSPAPPVHYPTLTSLKVQAEHAVRIPSGHLIRHSTVVSRVLIHGNDVQDRITHRLVLPDDDAGSRRAHEHWRVVVDVLDDDLGGDGGGEPGGFVLTLVGGGDDDGVLGVNFIVDGVAEGERAGVLVDREDRLRGLLADAVPVGGGGGGVSVVRQRGLRVGA